MDNIKISPEFFKGIGPVADPGPPFMVLWEYFAKEQQIAIVQRGLDRKIRQIEFEIETKKLELAELHKHKEIIKAL